MKICKDCKVEKSLEDFHRKQGEQREARCKPCRKENDKKYRDRKFAYDLNYYYNLSVERYNEMLAEQGGVCGLCKKEDEKWHVDHDHKCCPGRRSCGKCVRGLLCMNCNHWLGKYELYYRDLDIEGYLDKQR